MKGTVPVLGTNRCQKGRKFKRSVLEVLQSKIDLYSLMDIRFGGVPERHTLNKLKVIPEIRRL